MAEAEVAAAVPCRRATTPAVRHTPSPRRTERAGCPASPTTSTWPTAWCRPRTRSLGTSSAGSGSAAATGCCWCSLGMTTGSSTGATTPGSRGPGAGVRWSIWSPCRRGTHTRERSLKYPSTPATGCWTSWSMAAVRSEAIYVEFCTDPQGGAKHQEGRFTRTCQPRDIARCRGAGRGVRRPRAGKRYEGTVEHGQPGLTAEWPGGVMLIFRVHSGDSFVCRRVHHVAL